MNYPEIKYADRLKNIQKVSKEEANELLDLYLDDLRNVRQRLNKYLKSQGIAINLDYSKTSLEQVWGYLKTPVKQAYNNQRDEAEKTLYDLGSYCILAINKLDSSLQFSLIDSPGDMFNQTMALFKDRQLIASPLQIVMSLFFSNADTALADQFEKIKRNLSIR